MNKVICKKQLFHCKACGELTYTFYVEKYEAYAEHGPAISLCKVCFDSINKAIEEIAKKHSLGKDDLLFIAKRKSMSVSEGASCSGHLSEYIEKC